MIKSIIKLTEEYRGMTTEDIYHEITEKLAKKHEQELEKIKLENPEAK